VSKKTAEAKKGSKKKSVKKLSKKAAKSVRESKKKSVKKTSKKAAKSVGASALTQGASRRPRDRDVVPPPPKHRR
jgi:hypothetical protein